MALGRTAFPFIRYSRQLKRFFSKGKNFLTNPSFWLVETNFLCSRNSIVLLELCRRFYKAGVATFLRETLILLVKTNFILFNLFFYKQKPSLKLVGKTYLQKTLLQQKQIFHTVETVFFFGVLLSCKWKPLLRLVETSSLCYLKWLFLISK